MRHLLAALLAFLLGPDRVLETGPRYTVHWQEWRTAGFEDRVARLGAREEPAEILWSIPPRELGAAWRGFGLLEDALAFRSALGSVHDVRIVEDEWSDRGRTVSGVIVVR